MLQQHMVEYNRRNLTHNRSINAQMILTSFREAVGKATSQGVIYGEKIYIDNWELMFSKPRSAGQLPVIYHAKYQPLGY